MTQSNKSPVVAWLFWALLSFTGAHRLYLRVPGWWYYPAALVVWFCALLLGAGLLGMLINIALLVLWVYDAAHMSRWLEAGGDK